MNLECDYCGAVLEIPDGTTIDEANLLIDGNNWSTGIIFYNSDLESNDVVDLIQCERCTREFCDNIGQKDVVFVFNDLPRRALI